MVVFLKKSSKTKTSNNSYRVTLKGGKVNKILGSWDGNSNKIILDLQLTIRALAKGAKFSSSFQKVFVKSTGFLSQKKIIRVKY